MESKHTSNQKPKNLSNTDTTRIEQKGNELIIQVKLSGYNRKDLRVEISNNSLSIMTAHIPESIIKTIQLPANANIERTRANYHDNVLTISIPLRDPEVMRMHIWHKPRILPIE
jgi:HSP20 family molecular chaperone IbpA